MFWNTICFEIPIELGSNNAHLFRSLCLTVQEPFIEMTLGKHKLLQRVLFKSKIELLSYSFSKKAASFHAIAYQLIFRQLDKCVISGILETSVWFGHFAWVHVFDYDHFANKCVILGNLFKNSEKVIVWFWAGCRHVSDFWQLEGKCLILCILLLKTVVGIFPFKHFDWRQVCDPRHLIQAIVWYGHFTWVHMFDYMDILLFISIFCFLFCFVLFLFYFLHKHSVKANVWFQIYISLKIFLVRWGKRSQCRHSLEEFQALSSIPTLKCQVFDWLFFFGYVH